MRSDLTTAFETAMAADGRAPVQLLEFHFSAGTVYVSDREIGTADGLANDYAALVEDWGALEDIAAADDPGELSAEVREMSISLWNGGDPPFSEHFLREDPENIAVDLYQWFDGLSADDAALIDRFVIADPIRFNERMRLVQLDLVSLAANFDQMAGALLSAADWPNALQKDIGKPLNLLLGSCGEAPTLCAKTAPSATLNGSILADSLTVTVNEDLDALGFDAAGVLQIGEELLQYSSRTASAFTIAPLGRGYLSTASEHLDRDAVVQKIDDHTYLIGRGPLGQAGAVKVGGFAAPASIYSLQLGSDPARVVFSEKPYSIRYAAGSTFLAMQFDTIGSGNAAVQPHLAYDAASDATAARIDEDHRRLALRQTTVNPDRGAIVKAYLAVEHWESSAFAEDYAEVWVEGVGVVGRLSRPNPADSINIEAEVDIDHGHSHEIGGEHTHVFQDPIIAATATPHSHVASTGGSSTTYTGTRSSFSVLAPMEKDSVNFDYWETVTFPTAPTSFDGATLFLTKGGTAPLRVYLPDRYLPTVIPAGERFVTIDSINRDQAFGVTFEAVGTGTSGAYATVDDLRVEILIDLVVEPAVGGVDAQLVTSGANETTASDKAADDVNDLATDNAEVQVTGTQAATRSHVNLFDITAAVNFDWSWFNGRDIRVTYQGSADNQAIYILHCFFDIEYRKRERQYSDAVTVEIESGLIDDGAGTVTGTPSGAITRADHVARYLLTQRAGFDAARIHTSTFTSAAARLATKGYTVDGRLDGDMTVKEALKKVLFQNRLRLYFNAGVAKLVFVEALGDWPEGDAITPDDYQLKSLSIERQPARNVVNIVNIFYQRDLVGDAASQVSAGYQSDDPAAYQATATAANAASIAKHGARSNDDKFLFDLVADANQAEDLAIFYADRYAWPSNYIKAVCYLPKFPLEKEDKVSVTSSGFHKLRKAKARIVGAARGFGSGKHKAINTIEFLLECLRYILIEQTAADAVNVLDALTVSLGLDADFDDSLPVLEELRHAVGVGAEDAVAASDVLSMVAAFAPTHTDAATVADDVGVHVGVNLDLPVNLSDDALAWRTFGFGGGEYGGSGFGGQVIWYNRAPDELQAGFELFIDLRPGEFADTVSAADDLFFSCGFGCPLGSGFGLGPFGA